MLKLWCHPDSSNGLKVQLLLAELGLPYETVEVGLAQPRPADYLAINPLGGIPTLQDDNLTLSESQAILRYLAARERREDLYPSDLRERALVDEFLDRFATRLRTPLFRREALALGWTAARGFSDADADPAAVPKIEAEIQPSIALLDSVVGDRGAVLGRFTIADCALTPVLQRARDTGLDLSPHRRLEALADTLLSRPTWTGLDRGV